jgi:hypothetical protein
VKVIYWATSASRFGVINTSVTGVGSVEEECYMDALEWVKNNLPFNLNIELKKISEISDAAQIKE